MPDSDAIPVVPGLPGLGNTLDLTQEPIPFMARAYQEYGPVFRLRVPGRTITILAGLEANQLFTTHGDTYLKLGPIYGRLVEETGSAEYLPTLDEPAYSYYRRLLKPRLSREALEGCLPEAVALIERTVATWRPGQKVYVPDAMTRLCVEIISQATARTEVGDELAAIVLFTNRLIGSGVAFQPAFLLRLPDYQGAKARFEAFLQRIVDAHRAHAGPNDDYIDLLLRLKTMAGHPLTGHDLLAYVHLPYVNGVAYAPRLCGYLLYELLRAPELLERIRAETEAAAATGGLSVASLRQMRWLYAACMETLRRYPVAGALPRYVAKPFTFGGYTIAAGQQIFIATGVAHFLPEVYREPERFDPERFFAPRAEHQRPGAFAPYGLGPRTCLSAGMGEALIMVIMATLLRHVELALPRPGYRLRTRVAPIPGPDQRFTVRVLGRRTAEAPDVLPG